MQMISFGERTPNYLSSWVHYPKENDDAKLWISSLISGHTYLQHKKLLQRF